MTGAARPYPEGVLTDRCRAKLHEVEVSHPWAEAALRAMLHASRHGVDSHGFRLTPTYCRMIASGQVNPKPDMKIKRTGPAAALIDADNGLGHHPSYTAMEHACQIAAETGISAIGVSGSSHNGAAGAYALAGAEAGCIALSCTNADAAVALHGAAAAFHGTNPIAAAAPVADGKPWLLDMATSSIPLNRVFLYNSLGKELPPGVAADKAGKQTIDPKAVEMLLPLGGEGFGFKGAGLAGFVTILSAALTGARLDPEMARMSREATPVHRNCGHFFIAIDPARFIGAAAFAAAMTAYVAALRATPPVEGAAAMAPGDREWAVALKRGPEGIPIDSETAAFLGL